MCVLAFAGAARGAVVFGDLGGVTLLDPGSTFLLDLNGDGVDDFRIRRLTERLAVIGQFHGNGVLRESPENLFARRLVEGDAIGPAGVFETDRNLGVRFCDPNTGSCAWFGPWPSSQQPELMGLAFLIDGETHYGWLRISTTRQTGVMRIWDFAYETRAGVGILAGAIPSPGTAVAMGWGALLAARRRR